MIYEMECLLLGVGRGGVALSTAGWGMGKEVYHLWMESTDYFSQRLLGLRFFSQVEGHEQIHHYSKQLSNSLCRTEMKE